MPKQTIAQKTVYWMKVISLGLILGLGIQFAEAWTSPSAAPPGGNVSGPLTTSGVGQIKAGNLALNTDGYVNALLIPSGNVGIGTVNPIVPVHLFSTNPDGYTEQMLIEGTGNEGGYLRLQGKWPLLRFMSSVAPSGKKGFAFQNDGAGRLVLGTLGDDLGWKNSTSSRVMSWTSDENVGVGTVDPIDKLDVNGAIHTNGTAAGSRVSEMFMDYCVGGGCGAAGSGRIVAVGPDATTYGKFSLQLYNGNGDALYPFTVMNNGNVGINTGKIAPTEKLEVNGSVKVTGDILTNGSAGSSYGAVTLKGSKNTWSGINFKDASGSNAGTLMMRSDYSGFFNAADNNWRWLVDNAGNSIQPGKAFSASTATGDAGTTLVTKDYVDGKGVLSGTLCGREVVGLPTVNCNGQRPLNDGCPTGYSQMVIGEYSGNWIWSCSKN